MFRVPLWMYIVLILYILCCKVKLVQSGIARGRIYFPHWLSSRIIQYCTKKSIKIIFHGTYLFMSENRWRWLFKYMILVDLCYYINIIIIICSNTLLKYILMLYYTAPTFSRQLAHRWQWDCQPYVPATLYPQEDSWYSFLLEAESTPGP
jgi:hypothetical protein